MLKRKYLIQILLALIVVSIVIPTSFAEDTMLLTATDSSEPPALPDGVTPGDGGSPPEMPNGTMPQDGNGPPNDGGSPPEMPNGTQPSDEGQPPEMPNGTMPEDGGSPPEIPNGTNPGEIIDDTNTGKSVLSAENLTKVYLSDEDFTVKFVDSEGNNIIGQHLTITLTRVSNGLSKTYDVVSDYNGLVSLPINLAPGFYTALTSYTAIEGFNYTNASIFNTITVVSEDEANLISTSLIAEAFTKVVNTADNFTISLQDTNGNSLIGQHIALTLTRPSSGASKTYDVVTDYTGVGSLEINLAVGTYTVTGEFAGQGDYSKSSASTTITVVEKEEESENNPPEIPNGTDNNPPEIPNGTQPGEGGQPPEIPNGTQPGEGGQPPEAPGDNTGNTTTNDEETNITGDRIVVSGTSETVRSGNYTTSDSDTNTVLVQNGGSLELSGVTITKYGDTGDTGENSEFYGINAGVLVTANSYLNLTDSSIVTNAKGANAVFSSNLASSASGATIYISNVDINTYKDKSRGLDATYGGIIIGDNVTINTRGGSCAALATDRGEGTVTATNSILNTGVDSSQTGSGSPVIYSTGAITAINCTGTAYQSQIGCIEGKNSITLVDCDLTGYGKGNRESNGEYVDLGGFFIYQSMSGDADVGTATLNATNTKLTIPSDSSYYTTAPMFHVTNTAAIINLNNCTLNFGSNILLDVSSQDQWGTSGSNGGDLTFTSTNQDLNGNIIVDKISSLSLTLKDSTYTGAINPSGDYGTTNIVISSGSTWTLTGDSYITSLTNDGTINTGSYKLYVNGVEYTG